MVESLTAHKGAGATSNYTPILCESQTMNIGTYQNKDDLNGAVDGLAKFCHSFCMNCEETEKQNDLVFRCKECPFEREDKKCSVKVFLNKYATKEQIDKSTAMGSL